MKKLFFPLLAVVLLFAGCRKDPDIVNITQVGSEVLSFQYDVRSNQWRLDSDCYVAECTVPEITQNVFNHGAVMVYVWNGDWYALPYVYPFPVDNIIVPENIRFQWNVGVVRLVMQDLDAYAPAAPTDMSFKICVVRN